MKPIKRVLIVLAGLLIFGHVVVIVFDRPGDRLSVSAPVSVKPLINLGYERDKKLEKVIKKLASIGIKNRGMRALFIHSGGILMPRNIEYLMWSSAANPDQAVCYLNFSRIVPVGMFRYFAGYAGFSPGGENEFVNTRDNYTVRLVKNGIIAFRGGVDFNILRPGPENAGSYLTLNNSSGFLSEYIKTLSSEKEYDFFPSAGAVSGLTARILKENGKSYLEITYEKLKKGSSAKIKNDLDFLVMLLDKLLSQAGMELKKDKDTQKGLRYEISG